MLNVGLDLSRKQVEVCLISDHGELIDRFAATPDGDAWAEEFGPERTGLDLADIQTDDLSHAGLVHRVAITSALDTTPRVADLDLLGRPEARWRSFDPLRFLWPPTEPVTWNST